MVGTEDEQVTDQNATRSILAVMGLILCFVHLHLLFPSIFSTWSISIGKGCEYEVLELVFRLHVIRRLDEVLGHVLEHAPTSV